MWKEWLLDGSGMCGSGSGRGVLGCEWVQNSVGRAAELSTV